AFQGWTPKVLTTDRVLSSIALLFAYASGSIETLTVKISCCSISLIACGSCDSYLSKWAWASIYILFFMAQNHARSHSNRIRVKHAGNLSIADPQPPVTIVFTQPAQPSA